MIDYQGQDYQEVIGQQGLVVVQYFATWCGPCKMLKPVLESVATEMPETKFYRLDIDLYRNQAIEAGIRSVPTVVLYKDGEEVDRQSGYQPKERISSFTNSASIFSSTRSLKNGFWRGKMATDMTKFRALSMLLN